MPNQRLVRVHELMILVITEMTHFLWLTISGDTKIVKRKRLGWQRHEKLGKMAACRYSKTFRRARNREEWQFREFPGLWYDVFRCEKKEIDVN